MRRNLIFILGGIILLLVITRPTEDSFKNYLNKQFETTSQEGFFTSLVKTGYKLQSRNQIEYANKTLFALVTTRIGRKDVTFFGIAGMWFEL